MNEEALRQLIEEFITELQAILADIKEQKEQDSIDLDVFFDAVRKPLFGRLKATQVSGMEAKLKAFKEAGWPVAFAAYGLATSYHETGKRMQPVREGFDVSDTWRRKNLRYYPHYGRGDVQLTWETNYQRADKELGLGGKLVNNLDLALDPDISARILVEGMTEGWFSKGQTLKRYLPTDRPATLAEFTKARPIVNVHDKDALIAGYAIKFQDALIKAGY